MKLPFGYVLSLEKASDDVSILSETDSASNTSTHQQMLFTGASIKPRYNALTGSRERLSDAPDINFGGGRKSKENLNELNGLDYWSSRFSKKKSATQFSLGKSFDIQDFQNVAFDDLVDIIADLSPEMSKALWDYLLLCNPGFECKAFPLTSREDVDESAQAALNEILDKLGSYHGVLGVFFDRLFKLFALRGSYMLELVLAPNGRDFVDVATPDTRTLSYKRITDPLRGQTWDFGQIQDGKFVSLNLPNVRYVPLHPSGDSIEGTPMFSSALFLAIFIMAVLRDTKRVVQHQGYMRLDVAILFDKMRDSIPEDTAADPQKLTKWMNQVADDVKRVYSSLEPDDTYIHSDSVEVRNPVGAVSADALDSIDALFKALERMAVRSLKSMPLLLGLDTSRSETQANREWEIYAKGIETIQHYVETGCEYIFELALQAQGVQADVEVKFETFRAAEKMRDVQVDYLQAKLSRYLYDSGVIDMQGMAEMNGREKASADEPRNLQMNDFVEPGLSGGADNPNPGEARNVPKEIGLKLLSSLRMPTQPQIDAAEEFIRQFAPEVLARLYGAEIATEADIIQ